jgi:hypothetical protein
MGGLEDFRNSGLFFGVIVNDRDSFVGLEGIGTVVEHFCRVAFDDGLSLDVEVPHHGVAVPTAHHVNVVQVDLAAHHSHGAAGAEGRGTRIGDAVGAGTGCGGVVMLTL